VDTNLHNSEPNSSSMNVVLENVPNMYDITETEYKLSGNINECSFRTSNTRIVQALNNLSQTDEKAISNYSFINLDFDFASLYLANVTQKEKYFISQIINHLSTSLATDCSINETLHNYKKTKQEESNIAMNESDTLFQLNKNASFHKFDYKNSKTFSPKLGNNYCSPTVKQLTKHDIQNSSTIYDTQKKCKKILDKMPTCTLDNSIISMSPNFNTPNKPKRKRENVIKTPSHIFNDSIISKSPNFATPIHAYRKRNLTKTPCVKKNDYFSPKISKRSDKYESQCIEFNQCKKYIAQSTPRRRKRSIYKLHSGRKRFEPYQPESDTISDEFTNNSSLKPVNLDKTIFSVKDITCHGAIDSYSERSSLYSQKFLQIKQQNYSNQLTMQLDKGKYNEDSIIHSNNLNHLDKIDLNNSFNQMEKENEFTNNFDDKRSKNNDINSECITIRKDIFKTDKILRTTDISTNNVKSIYTTDSLQEKNIINCIDCDTKKLLNEDLSININETCKHENLSHKLAVKNNGIFVTNLPVIHGKHVHLSDFQQSSSLKVNRNSNNSKEMENLSQTKDLDLNGCKIEKNS